MEIKYCLLFTTILVLLQIVENASSDVVTLCAHIFSVSPLILPSVSASFSKDKCMLYCAIGSDPTHRLVINEGMPCPGNSSGTCHQGKCTHTTSVVKPEEPLKLCDHVHNVTAEKFATSHASYSNSKCSLSCVIGHTTLPPEAIHEGQHCPEDATGICRSGQCVGSLESALRECGLKHHLDFHTLGNHKGTAFTNDQCTLKCVLNDDVWSDNPEHEGLPCPANPNGVCRNGTCIL